MRVTSALWAKAYIRRVQGAFASAVVACHGNDEAGAIHIKIVGPDRTAALFSPAPMSLSAAPETDDGERRFTAFFPPGTPEATVDAHLARQREFDEDLWLIEVEDRDGRHFLDDWLG